MTQLGKILVFVNLAFSVMVLTWAVASYTNRVNWTKDGPQGDQPPGELFKREARFKSLQSALFPAQANWREVHTQVVGWEKFRSVYRTYYEGEMQHMQSKADAKVKDQEARTLLFEKGRLKLDDNTQLPLRAVAVDRNGKPMSSLDYYAGEEAKTLDALQKVLDDYKKEVELDTQLTERLIGPLGLQERLNVERRKREDMIDRIDYFKPLLVNVAVESELLIKRRKQLESRIEELQAIGASR
jgi:hypothetical protein